MYYFIIFPSQGTQVQPVNQSQAYLFYPPTYEMPSFFPYNNQNSLNLQPQPAIAHRQQVPQSHEIELKIEEDVRIRKSQEQKMGNKVEKLPFVDKHNIIPNNINHILAFIQRKSKSGKVVQKLIEKFKLPHQEFTSKTFYSYQSYVKNKLSVHVNIRALETLFLHLDCGCSIFTQEEQIFYNKVSRAAVRFYLKETAPLVTLNSKRLKNTPKEDHLKVQRYLLKKIESIKESCFEREREKAE